MTDPRNTINKTALETFYKNYFPFDLIFTLLQRGLQDNGKEKEQEGAEDTKIEINNQCREMKLQWNDINSRWNPVGRSALEFRTTILRTLPHRIDIGALYNVPMRSQILTYADVSGLKSSLGRELVFDIDISSYDNIRLCCREKQFCRRCWPLVTAACLILESLLKEAPFFLDPQRLLWVFSGRRGMHCWIVERAREHAHIFAWEDSARRALVEYIYAQLFASLSSPSNNKNSLDQEGVGLIPSFFLPPACKKIIRSYFQWYLTEFPNCMQQEKIANFVFSQLDENASLRARVELFFRRHASEKTALELWSALEQEVLVNFTQGPRASHCVAAQFVGSRLDRDITARREHCIKLMFCVHPDTGNICTAVPRDQLEHFFPDETSVPQYTNLHHSPASLNQYNQSIEAFRNILLPPSPPSPTVASL